MRTALITGACSGMGLALTQELLSLTSHSWRVVMADIQPPPATLEADETRWKYIRTDVSSWADSAILFKSAYEWDHENRIDFFAANAGIGDKESVYGPWGDLDDEPQEPNLKCVDVDLIAVLYGLKLFIHYSRKTKQALSAQASSFHPKMVITASCVGQYGFPIAPQYAASKHGLIGLTRSVAAKLLNDDDIAVNALMPAFIPTSLPSGKLVDVWPKEFTTPISTVVRAWMELIDDEGRVQEDGKSEGKNSEIKRGQTVECSIDRLFYRQEVEAPDEGQRFLKEAALVGGLWWSIYGGARGVETDMKRQEQERKQKANHVMAQGGTS